MMSVINLGKQGETNVRQVQLDVSRLVTLFGPGTVQLLHRRPGDVTPYPVALTRTEDVVTWTVTAADTAYSGEGQAELQYFAGDSLAKSETYTTTITASQGDAGATPPEPQAGWVTQVLQAGNDAAEAAERAENAVLHPPIIGENGNWWLWSFAYGVYVDSGTAAEGPQGPVGPQGPPGPAGSDADVTADNIEAALGFTPADAVAVTKELSRLSNEKVDKAALTLGYHTDGLIYIFVNGEPVGHGIELPTGGIDGYITEDNQIVFNNLPDGEYTLAYVMADGTLVPIGAMIKDTNVYYSVTNNLTNCTINNTATQVIQGESYSAVISAFSGYELSSVMVTMGGVDITASAVSGGNISIAEVTGNIVITAVATEIQAGPSYTNLLPLAANADGTLFVGTNGEQGYKYGYRIKGSTGAEEACENEYCTGYLEAGYYDVIRIKNATLNATQSYNQFVFYDSNHVRVYAAQFAQANIESGGIYSIKCSDLTETNNMAYVRICCGVISDETIITINEEIV